MQKQVKMENYWEICDMQLIEKDSHQGVVLRCDPSWDVTSGVDVDEKEGGVDSDDDDDDHQSVVLRCRPRGVRSDCRSCRIIPPDSRLH